MTSKETIAFTLWGEARNQPEEGILAVASVIYNRTVERLKRFEDEIPADAMVKVCLAPHQFSSWTKEIFNQQEPSDCDKWTICCKIAEDMVSGAFEPTIDATSYFADYIEKPYWANAMTFVTKIGQHLFYK